MSSNYTMASEYTKTYTSFSGADITATFGDTVIGELQAVTYSVSREKSPVYTLGSAEVRSFSRGKRGIAGSLVFTVFDHDALLEAMKKHCEKAGGIHRVGGDDVVSTPMTIDQWDEAMTGKIAEAGTGTTSALADARTNKASEIVMPRYIDEIPPFDITISYCNEYGNQAVMTILGVEILNSGSGNSIDSVTTEQACTYIARKIEPMRKVEDTISG